MNEEVVTLRPARREEIPKIWQMQLKAFEGLLEKYQDYDTNPAAESMEKIVRRFEMEGSTYYLIMAGMEEVGVIRIVDKKDQEEDLTSVDHAGLPRKRICTAGDDRGRENPWIRSLESGYYPAGKRKPSSL